jgi:hypothetical protein
MPLPEREILAGGRKAVPTQQAHALGDLGIPDESHATVADTTQDLAWGETEPTSIT